MRKIEKIFQKDIKKALITLYDSHLLRMMAFVSIQTILLIIYLWKTRKGFWVKR